jgi:hypothetical protein
MFWIALAAQLSLPVPLGLRFPDVRSVFSTDDMPTYVQVEGITRLISTRTTIRPDGTVQDCTSDRGSGDEKLAAFTCSIIVKRAKYFQPAKWVDGSPAYAIIRVPIVWAIGFAPTEAELRKAYPADLDIFVSRLPKGVKREASVSLMIAVDEAGRIVSCGEASPVFKDDHRKAYPELVPIACRQAMSQIKTAPAKDVSGKPVRSVQTVSVSFSTGP